MSRPVCSPERACSDARCSIELAGPRRERGLGFAAVVLHAGHGSLATRTATTPTRASEAVVRLALQGGVASLDSRLRRFFALAVDSGHRCSPASSARHLCDLMAGSAAACVFPGPRPQAETCCCRQDETVAGRSAAILALHESRPSPPTRAHEPCE